MKRIFSILLLGVLLMPALLAQNPKNLNADQLELRSDVFNFLKQEGYMPEIDSDGDIKFKAEGKIYYVSVDAKDENPMYLVFYRPSTYPEKYSKNTLLLATEQLNRYKGVKLVCFNNFYRVGAELYLRSAEAFKGCFYQILNNIDALVSDILEECENVKNSGSSSNGTSPITILSLDVANVDENNNIITDWNSTIYSSQTKYLKPRINFTSSVSSGTFTLYVKLKKNNVLQYNSSTSPNGYTYSVDVSISESGYQTKYLSGWGSVNAGFWSAGTYSFEVWHKGKLLFEKSFYIN